MTSSVHSTLSLAQLSRELTGRIITPDDGEYDAARTVVSGEIDCRPAAIVRVADATDVARVIDFARENAVELAVRSGGHSGAGHGTTEGGIVLDLRDMKDIAIDPEASTAWAESGCTAAEVTAATAANGLAIGFGDTGSVGIGGITLGGGVGYLVRKHGLTIDNLLAAEIVTADGELLRVDNDNHPDLFWAIRGGGGNFGVVTRFLYRLHPLEQVTGGMLILPADAEIISGFMALLESAPDELSGIANVMNCPPMPFVPEEHHGSLVVMAMLCHAGDADAGEQAMAPFRALAEPLADLVKSMPYPEMFPPEDGSYRPTAASLTMLTERIGLEESQTIMERLAESDAAVRVAQLRVLGGAMARVNADATAFVHRSSRIMVNVAAFYEGAEDRPGRAAWVAELAGALRQGDDGVYVNFLADEGPDRVRAAYPGATWDRLTEVKARYDPTNLFHRNQNVPPAQ